jgi:hypothetical protein
MYIFLPGEMVRGVLGCPSGSISIRRVTMHEVVQMRRRISKGNLLKQVNSVRGSVSGVVKMNSRFKSRMAEGSRSPQMLRRSVNNKDDVVIDGELTRVIRDGDADIEHHIQGERKDFSSADYG